MIKRVFDFVFSASLLVVLFPFLVILAILVVATSKGPLFILQMRIGKNEQPFRLVKFRTMKPNSENLGLLTIGNRDDRVTQFGYFLRKYKLDELPQFWNVLKGEMSMVGPRPEVKKYVDLYTPEQKQIFAVKPGITDVSSLYFWNESELLGEQENPENYYITTILPQKLKMSLTYQKSATFISDLGIIFKTIKSFFSR